MFCITGCWISPSWLMRWKWRYAITVNFLAAPLASYQIRKVAGCACAGKAGNVFPATDFKGNRWLTIPPFITARVSRTCREACRDRSSAVAGNRSWHSRCMRNPQFFVSGKRPIHTPIEINHGPISGLSCSGENGNETLTHKLNVNRTYLRYQTPYYDSIFSSWGNFLIVINDNNKPRAHI